MIALILASGCDGVPTPSPPTEHTAPVTVRVDLPPQAPLLNLVLLADHLKPDVLVVADPAALGQQAVTVRCDGEVTPDAVWLAMEVALRINGWSLQSDGGTVTPVPTPELWHRGDRVVDLLAIDAEAVDAIHRMLDKGVDRRGDLAVEWSESTLILGGPAARVASLRHSVEAVSARAELLTGDTTVLCPQYIGESRHPRQELSAAPNPGTTVRLNFAPGSSLLVAAQFFCSLRRAPLAVTDVAALERDAIRLRVDRDLSPEAAFRTYLELLAVHGWALRRGPAIEELVPTEPWVPEGEAAMVEVVALRHLTVDQAAAGGSAARVAAMPEPNLVIVSGSERSVAAAVAQISALEADAGR